jgi:hypothetical protein
MKRALPTAEREKMATASPRASPERKAANALMPLRVAPEAILPRRPPERGLDGALSHRAASAPGDAAGAPAGPSRQAGGSAEEGSAP